MKKSKFRKTITYVAISLLTLGIVSSSVVLFEKNKDDSDIIAGKKLSILGDSISTYTGWSNNSAETNSTIGGNTVRYNGSYILTSVNQTWWKQAADETGMEILVNNSWAGSRVTTTRSSADAGCLTRARNLHDDTGKNSGETPDIIAIYLGINDFDNKVELGEFQELSEVYDYATQTYIGEVTVFAPAYAMMLHKILIAYPKAEIYCFTHVPNSRRIDTEVLEQYNDTIHYIADYFHVNVVDLYAESGVTYDNCEEYTGDGLHPNAAGMDLITDCFIRALKK